MILLTIIFVASVGMVDASSLPRSMGSAIYPKFYNDGIESPRPGICTSAQLAACQVIFNQVAGILDTDDFLNPDQLAADIDKVMMSSRNGYAQVCNARAQYQDCLGTTNYNLCLSPTYYLNLGYNSSLAYAYESIFRQLEFACIDGLEVGTDGFQCIMKSFVVQHGKLEECYASYNNSAQDCLTIPCICQAGQEYGKCVGENTANYCQKVQSPYEASGGWWACQYTVADGYLYNCKNTCSVSSFGSASD